MLPYSDMAQRAQSAWAIRLMLATMAHVASAASTSNPSYRGAIAAVSLSSLTDEASKEQNFARLASIKISCNHVHAWLGMTRLFHQWTARRLRDV